MPDNIKVLLGGGGGEVKFFIMKNINVLHQLPVRELCVKCFKHTSSLFYPIPFCNRIFTAGSCCIGMFHHTTTWRNSTRKTSSM